MELGSSQRAHAIIIGGSIVGSATAAMLASRFERITIIDRDAFPDAPATRAGVPQARHVHALLARGASELERLFPGFVKELVDAGAQRLDVGRDIAWLTPAGWGLAFDSGVVLCCATRNLIEWHVRQRASRAANVTVLDETMVTGLITDGARSRVTGVRVRTGRGADATTRDLAADLVIDASGRGSQLPEWLESINRSRVREIVIDARMAYASRFYTIDRSALRGWSAAYVQPALPRSRRGGILFPVEGGRFHLTLFGYAEGGPPTDEAGFAGFMRGLRSSILADVLASATPLTPIVAHRRTENRWRRFDQIRDWPDRLIALGDAVCCFDPVYGQGMTTGILQALVLASTLDASQDGGVGQPGFARRVQRRLVSVIRPAWNLATSEDLRLETTVGGALRAPDRFLQRYLDRVIATATADATVRRRLLHVMNMLSGPQTLMRPSTAARVLVHLYSRRKQQSLWTEQNVARSAPPSTGEADHRSARQVAIAGRMH